MKNSIEPIRNRSPRPSGLKTLAPETTKISVNSEGRSSQNGLLPLALCRGPRAGMPVLTLKSILPDERRADSARDVNLYVNCSLPSVQSCGMMEILCVQIWNLHIKSSCKIIIIKKLQTFSDRKTCAGFFPCHALV